MTEKQLRFTKKIILALRRRGVGFYASSGYGCFDATTNILLNLLTHEPEQVYAKMHGITLDQYRRWLDGMKHGGLQCEGTTQKGQRCKLAVTWCGPPEEVPFAPRFCAKHTGQEKKISARP